MPRASGTTGMAAVWPDSSTCAVAVALLWRDVSFCCWRCWSAESASMRNVSLIVSTCGLFAAFDMITSSAAST